MTTTPITPQTVPAPLWSALYELRNAVLAARQDGDHAGAITVDAMRAVAIVALARLTVARWAATRPALEATLRPEPVRRRRSAQQAPAAALDRVAAGNVALALLAQEREAEARRNYRAELEGQATREAVIAALEELAVRAEGRGGAERFRKAAGYVRDGATFRELAGAALAVTRGGSAHDLEPDQPCTCPAGQNGRPCWATAVAEAIGMAKRRALADLEGRRAA